VRRIVFWQPIDSPHQDAFLEAVGRRFSGEVILGVERRLPTDRAAQGWPEPRHEVVRLEDISLPVSHAALATHGEPESLHVFSGLMSHPLVWAGFRQLANTNARMAIYSEAPEQPPLTGWIKRLRGRLIARRWAWRFAFVLAIGTVGRDFFRRIGWPPERIVPFGYFSLPHTDPPPPVRPDHASTFRLVSAGQLIRRKGIDLILKGCSGLPSSGWQLDIYGDGPERFRLKRLAAALGLGERVSFHGTVANELLLRAIAAADGTILPSRFDGWGMLVSESLALGTPAICTTQCGAALLADHGDWRDAGPPPLVVAAPTADGLATAIRSLVSAGQPSEARRALIRRGMAPASPDAAAARFLDLVAAL
jgi:glycosyltransferase involved in cell wall biosynthesis